MKLFKFAAAAVFFAVISSAAASASPILTQKLYEDFESGCELTGVQIFEEENGNKAMRLCDELTDIVYTPPENSVIEGSFKVTKLFGGQNIFEIIPQSSPMGEKYFGGGNFSIFSIDLHRGFVRIGKTVGEDVKINVGWNSFKITTVGQKVFFEVNETLTCAEQAQRNAGLIFRAEGCDILIDNLKISEIATRGATLTGLIAAKTKVTVSPYEPYDFINGVGLLLSYSSGTRVNPVNNADVSYTVSGNYRELSNGYGYFYGDSEVCFTYKGHSCTVSITVNDNGMTKGEYLCADVYKRRQELAYIAYDTLNTNGFLKTTAGYSRLFELLSAAYLYPASESHEEIISHFLKIAEETVFETRGSIGAEDFIAIDLLLLACNERLNISAGLRSRLDNYFLGLDFSNPEEILSENHRMTYYAIGILAAEHYPDGTFFNGLSARQNKELYKGYILDWIDFRLKYGMGEYDSPNYYTIDFAALETIYTFTNDTELKRRVYEMLMYLYTDAALDSNNGVMGGAQSRLYVNTLRTGEIPALDVFFDDCITPDKNYTLQMLPLCYSEFLPQQSLIEQKADRKAAYIHAEKRRIYTIPDDPKLTGMLTKYAYVTPDYIIGSLVESDNLPETSYKSGDKYYVNTGTFSKPTRVLPDFQAVGFSINIRGNPLLNIIDSHPGGGYNALSGAHSYFSGDHGCHCARYGQHEHTVLGIRRITDKELPQFSHFYINKSEFDEIIERSGWIILRSGDVYAALRPLADSTVNGAAAYEWGSDEELFSKTPLSQLEVKINSADSAFIAEVYSRSEIGEFNEFADRICSAEIIYTGNTLTYTNLAGDTLTLDYAGETLYRNGRKKVYTGAYSDYCADYVKSGWGADIINYASFTTPRENYVNVYKMGAGLYKIIPLTQRGRLFAAVYDENGYMQSVSEYMGKEEFEISGERVKAIVLDSTETMKPVTLQAY